MGELGALHDAVKSLDLLPSALMMDLQAPFSPSGGALHGLTDIILQRGIGDALVESHEDVGPDAVLEPGGRLGRHFPGAPVQVGLELHALLADLAQVSQAEHLESPAVGQDGFVPMHEGVQPSGFFNEIHAGSKHEMIGISQEDFRAAARNVLGRKGLDRGLGSHRHEAGSPHFPVSEPQYSAPRGNPGILGRYLKFMHGNVPSSLGSDPPTNCKPVRIKKHPAGSLKAGTPSGLGHHSQKAELP